MVAGALESKRAVPTSSPGKWPGGESGPGGITIQNFILSIWSSEHLRDSLTYDPTVEGLLGVPQSSAWGWAAFLSSCASGALYWLWKMMLVAGSFWSHDDTLTSNVPVPEPPRATERHKWTLELFWSPQATRDHLARRGSSDLPTRVTNPHGVLNSASLKSMTSFIKQTVKKPDIPKATEEWLNHSGPVSFWRLPFFTHSQEVNRIETSSSHYLALQASP